MPQASPRRLDTDPDDVGDLARPRLAAQGAVDGVRRELHDVGCQVEPPADGAPTRATIRRESNLPVCVGSDPGERLDIEGNVRHARGITRFGPVRVMIYEREAV